MAKNLKKEEKVTLNLIKDLLEERFSKHEKTITTFISDNNKLIHEKLDGINRRIDDQNERIKALETLNDEFKESLDVTHDILEGKIKNVNKNLSELSEEINAHRHNNQEKVDIGLLRDKLRDMEDRSRRNNLRIDGIEDEKEETWEDTERKVLSILTNNLNLQNIRIERAHRMGPHNNDKKRTVIIKLLDYKDKVGILKNAKNLKNTGLYINEDFSNETMAIRKQLWNDVKQLRLQGKFAVLKYDRIYCREKR